MSDERAANVIDVRLGQKVRARRMEAGLSQERLAELLGVTFQQVQKYEKGINRIAASRLFQISAALEVSVAYFFDGLHPARADGVAEEGPDGFVYDALATPEGMQMLTLFGSIRSGKLRRRVLDLLRTLTAEEDDEDALPANHDLRT